MCKFFFSIVAAIRTSDRWNRDVQLNQEQSGKVYSNANDQKKSMSLFVLYFRLLVICCQDVFWLRWWLRHLCSVNRNNERSVGLTTNSSDKFVHTVINFGRAANFVQFQLKLNNMANKRRWFIFVKIVCNNLKVTTFSFIETERKITRKQGR